MTVCKYIHIFTKTILLLFRLNNKIEFNGYILYIIEFTVMLKSLHNQNKNYKSIKILCQMDVLLLQGKV